MERQWQQDDELGSNEKRHANDGVEKSRSESKLVATFVLSY
jgi:hypothetical protein